MLAGSTEVLSGSAAHLVSTAKPRIALVTAPNGPVQHTASLFGAPPGTSCSCCAGHLPLACVLDPFLTPSFPASVLSGVCAFHVQDGAARPAHQLRRPCCAPATAPGAAPRAVRRDEAALQGFPGRAPTVAAVCAHISAVSQRPPAAVGQSYYSGVMHGHAGLPGCPRWCLLCTLCDSGPTTLQQAAVCRYRVFFPCTCKAPHAARVDCWCAICCGIRPEWLLCVYVCALLAVSSHTRRHAVFPVHPAAGAPSFVAVYTIVC